MINEEDAGEVVRDAEGEVNTMSDEIYLRVSQVCDIAQIGRSTVFLWSRTGRMPSQRKFGRLSRWNRNELLDWMAGRKRGPYGEGEEGLSGVSSA